MSREKERGVMTQERRAGRFEQVSKKTRQEEIWMRKQGKRKGGEVLNGAKWK